MKNYIEFISIFIAMISAISAAYSPRQSKKAVDVTLYAMASQLLQSQSEKYISDKMKQSIRLLIEYYKKK